jgi:alpha-D-ribose 1-methylphosphonate 5-triphosphate synthase subunit PhnL
VRHAVSVQQRNFFVQRQLAQDRLRPAVWRLLLRRRLLALSVATFRGGELVVSRDYRTTDDSKRYQHQSMSEQ